MKNFSVMVALLFVVCSAFSQTQQSTQTTNGWVLIGGLYGTVDLSLTGTYLENSNQVFKNYGTSKEPGLFVTNWTKPYPSRLIPQKISGEFNLSGGSNLDSLEIYVAIQDSLDHGCLFGQKYILKQGWSNFAWDMKWAQFSTYNRITFVFQFRTTGTLNTGGTISLRNLLAINGNDSSVIDLSVSSVTGVSPLVQTPKGFKLEQNYPNPFNPSTTIRYSVPKMEHVSLTVFNSLGQEVRNLVSEMKAQGSYEVNFDASNLPSGIYFYRLQAGSFVETKRMSFVK